MEPTTRCRRSSRSARICRWIGYRLHPDEVEGVVSIGFDDAIALFDGSLGAVPALELGAMRARACGALEVAVSDFAAGEVGGYAVRALHGLRTVVDGGVPEPFELR